ncbi:ABC transporter ATP-binding protein [Embleya sp. AB8]|uniref:ABC transporter ATP-binding protein n=1 Tax=Embleya sp. AB8 TaxID=3156304 RepID=UPI003C794D39
MRSPADAAPPPAGPALDLTGVGHTYRSRGRPGRVVLAGLDLSVTEGEFLVVVGPSGCGKTTLLGLLAGFLPATSGQVRTFGRAVRGPGPDRGVVFQQPRLFPWLSVRRNVEFGLRGAAAFGADRTARRARAADLLGTVGLAEVADARPHELSGGMQQRVAIARALVPDPAILLMDEPFSALDALTREQLQDELRALWLRSGKTIVLITHSVDEAAYLATRVVALGGSPGRIVLDRESPLPRTRPADPTSIRSTPDFIALRDETAAAVRGEPTPSAEPAPG